MLVVPTLSRKQWGEVSAAPPGVLALSNGEAVRTEPAVQPGWFAAPPSLPQWPGPAPSPLSASIPRRALLPHTTGMRKKNEKTYQLTPLYQQSRNQDPVLPKTGGRKADREGRRH